MRSEEPSTACVSAAASRPAEKACTPSGSGFVLPARTTARTRHPASRNASERCQPTHPLAPVMLTTEGLVIDAVRLVPASAGRRDARVDELVVFERPRQFGDVVAAEDGVVMAVGDEERIQAELPGIGHDAEEKQPQPFDD